MAKKKSPQEIAIERIEEAEKSNSEELDLSAIGINKVPSEISKLKKLKRLDLSSNNIEVLPNELFLLVELEELFIGGYSLAEEDLIETIKKMNPQVFARFYNILEQEKIRDYSIRMKGNRLSFLNPEICNLRKLKKLDISSNRLIEIPNTIGELLELEELYICYNKIGNIPQTLGNLVNLKILDASNNRISKIRSNLLDLPRLWFLNIEDNQMTSLPSITKNLNLKVLLVGGNKIKKIPEQIGSLEYLRILGFNSNLITALPESILSLKSLELLYLELNRNLQIPPEIIEKSYEPASIINYYFSLLKKKRKEINELKILFIGQGSVGKTSLIQRILRGTFDKNQGKTEGISINSWSIHDESMAIDRKSLQILTGKHQLIRLNLWDFGGQEIMHATHQFFLTKRSLYLLVLDSRLTPEENRVEYWLKIIQSFGGESPVLIIGNKIDQHPLDIDRTGLQKKYPNIVGILETSAATGAGIEELKAAITEQVNNLPHVRDLLPETWFTVKTKLEELGKQSNFITHDKYLDLCAENEVSDETSQRTLIGFLHDLGVVLHFQDDPRLEALGILNPQWVTNGVYKILNSHTLFQNKGVLTVSMLDEILNLPEYPRGKRLFIVDMMKKFELCYDMEIDKTFLVPDLLPKDEPNIDGREDALVFQYHYTVLPSSVITRFIVRMNEFVDEKVWRTGAVLKDGGNTAVVKADIEDRKVYIWVSGDEHKRHDFLSKIRGQFDAIHKTISKLEMKEMVPVPNHPEAEPVDYDLLLQMDHNNVEVYPVLSGGRMIVVNVREMLNGVARDSDRQRGNTTNIYVGGDVHADTFIAGNENQATVSKSDKKPKKKKP